MGIQSNNPINQRNHFKVNNIKPAGADKTKLSKPYIAYYIEAFS